MLDHPTPYLVISTAIVAEKYADISDACPRAKIFYAVKANPEPSVLQLLTDLGACFDVASPAEVDEVLATGCTPERISYGNTIKKSCDIEYAFARGVRIFAFDSEAELEKLAAHAPGATVFCRLLTYTTQADWPLSRKFGCEPEMAIDLLLRARELGLDPHGISFHVGSQQRDPEQYDGAIASAAHVFAQCAEQGLQLRLVNLGGGFPAHYLDPIKPMAEYGAAIDRALAKHFGDAELDLIIEPGRGLVADAGVLHTEVVLVSTKSYDSDDRWVYLDTGVFGGLAETLGESIKYRMTTSRDGGAVGPVILAGPTCDSMDVMYETYRYELPLDLRPGDRVLIHSAGAYTKTYCTDGFNGFEPIPAFCIEDAQL